MGFIPTGTVPEPTHHRPSPPLFRHPPVMPASAVAESLSAAATYRSGLGPLVAPPHGTTQR
jgi:hypothetical protein